VNPGSFIQLFNAHVAHLNGQVPARVDPVYKYLTFDIELIERPAPSCSSCMKGREGMVNRTRTKIVMSQGPCK